MKSNWINIADKSSSLFMLIFGIWTVASNMAVIFSLPFKFLPYLFLVLILPGIYLFHKYRFFKTIRVYETDVSSETYGKKGKILNTLIGFLIILVFIIAHFSHKPALDEAHYLCYSVDMADNPDNAVLKWDALGLFEGAPLLIPVYKVQSIESFCATLSLLTGIPVIYFFHFLLPAIGAFLIVMSFICLYNTLFPGKALSTTLISILILAFITYRTLGYNNLVHLQLGKAHLKAYILPLIINYGLKASVKGGYKNWLLLIMAQITAVGMNSTALWLAPCVANLSVLAGAFSSKKKIIPLMAQSLLSSSYIVLLGLFIIVNFKMPPFYVQNNLNSIELVAFSAKFVFGNPASILFLLLLILYSLLVKSSRLVKFTILIFSLVTVFIFYNPLFAGILSKHFISQHTYWRVSWLLPFSVYAGAIGNSLLKKSNNKASLFFKFLATILVFVGIHFTSPFHSVFSTKRDITFKAPSLKVTSEYTIAKDINKILEENDLVLSPNNVSIWLSTMHNHPRSLIYRIMFAKKTMREYTNQIESNKIEALEGFDKWLYWYEPPMFSDYPSNSALSKKIKKLKKETGQNKLEILQDYEFKYDLKQYINGKAQPNNPDEYIKNGIGHYGINAICILENNKWKGNIEKVLKDCNFVIKSHNARYKLWIKE